MSQFYFGIVIMINEMYGAERLLFNLLELGFDAEIVDGKEINMRHS